MPHFIGLNRDAAASYVAAVADKYESERSATLNCGPISAPSFPRPSQSFPPVFFPAVLSGAGSREIDTSDILFGPASTFLNSTHCTELGSDCDSDGIKSKCGAMVDGFDAPQNQRPPPSFLLIPSCPPRSDELFIRRSEASSTSSSTSSNDCSASSVALRCCGLKALFVSSSSSSPFPQLSMHKVSRATLCTPSPSVRSTPICSSSTASDRQPEPLVFGSPEWSEKRLAQWRRRRAFGSASSEHRGGPELRMAFTDVDARAPSKKSTYWEPVIIWGPLSDSQEIATIPLAPHSPLPPSLPLRSSPSPSSRVSSPSQQPQLASVSSPSSPNFFSSSPNKYPSDFPRSALACSASAFSGFRSGSIRPRTISRSEVLCLSDPQLSHPPQVVDETGGEEDNDNAPPRAADLSSMIESRARVTNQDDVLAIAVNWQTTRSGRAIEICADLAEAGGGFRHSDIEGGEENEEGGDGVVGATACDKALSIFGRETRPVDHHPSTGSVSFIPLPRDFSLLAASTSSSGRAGGRSSTAQLRPYLPHLSIPDSSAPEDSLKMTSMTRMPIASSPSAVPRLDELSNGYPLEGWTAAGLTQEAPRIGSQAGKSRRSKSSSAAKSGANEKVPVISPEARRAAHSFVALAKATQAKDTVLQDAALGCRGAVPEGVAGKYKVIVYRGVFSGAIVEAAFVSSRNETFTTILKSPTCKNSRRALMLLRGRSRATLFTSNAGKGFPVDPPSPARGSALMPLLASFPPTSLYDLKECTGKSNDISITLRSTVDVVQSSFNVVERWADLVSNTSADLSPPSVGALSRPAPAPPTASVDSPMSAPPKSSKSPSADVEAALAADRIKEKQMLLAKIRAAKAMIEGKQMIQNPLRHDDDSSDSDEECEVISAIATAPHARADRADHSSNNVADSRTPESLGGPSEKRGASDRPQERVSRASVGFPVTVLKTAAAGASLFGSSRSEATPVVEKTPPDETQGVFSSTTTSKRQRGGASSMLNNFFGLHSGDELARAEHLKRANESSAAPPTILTSPPSSSAHPQSSASDQLQMVHRKGAGSDAVPSLLVVSKGGGGAPAGMRDSALAPRALCSPEFIEGYGITAAQLSSKCGIRLGKNELLRYSGVHIEVGSSAAVRLLKVSTSEENNVAIQEAVADIVKLRCRRSYVRLYVIVCTNDAITAKLASELILLHSIVGDQTNFKDAVTVLYADRSSLAQVLAEIATLNEQLEPKSPSLYDSVFFGGYECELEEEEQDCISVLCSMSPALTVMGALKIVRVCGKGSGGILRNVLQVAHEGGFADQSIRDDLGISGESVTKREDLIGIPMACFQIYQTARMKF